VIGRRYGGQYLSSGVTLWALVVTEYLLMFRPATSLHIERTERLLARLQSFNFEKRRKWTFFFTVGTRTSQV